MAPSRPLPALLPGPTLQFVPSESFFPANGTSDMFWAMGPFNASFVADFCAAQFGAGGPLPDYGILPLRWGARASDFAAASNIIFSNGLLDPWSSGGWRWARAGPGWAVRRQALPVLPAGRLIQAPAAQPLLQFPAMPSVPCNCRRLPPQPQRQPGGSQHSAGGAPCGPLLARARGWVAWLGDGQCMRHGAAVPLVPERWRCLLPPPLVQQQ